MRGQNVTSYGYDRTYPGANLGVACPLEALPRLLVDLRRRMALEFEEEHVPQRAPALGCAWVLLATYQTYHSPPSANAWRCDSGWPSPLCAARIVAMRVSTSARNSPARIFASCAGVLAGTEAFASEDTP